MSPRRMAIGLGALALAGAGVALGITTAPDRAAAVRATAEGGNLGTNLAGVTYWDGAVPFADLIRQSGEWVSQREGGSWGTGPALALRADGWPARFVADQYATLPVADNHYPAGVYRVSWKGEGRFRINGTVFSGRAGRGTVTLDGSSLVLLDLLETNAIRPVHAVRMIAPGERATRTFRAAYLASLAPYRTLRFMDWQQTNGTFADPVPAHTCATRVRPGFVSQGQRRGASVEVMVKLANVRGADPWFTIPHTADASWIRCHARHVATSLQRGLVARYEFSNETWNPGFVQFHELRDDGVAHGLGGGDSYVALQQEVARRSEAAVRIVAEEFARSKRTAVRVMAGQAANDFVLDQRLQFEDAADFVDEIAIAPYAHVPGANPFDPAEADQIAALTTTQLFDRLTAGLDEEVTPWISSHMALAGRYAKRLVAYEGGQHLAGDSANGALTTLFVGANRDARMGTLYDAYLARWRSLTGNALFVHFTDVGPYGRFGSWGARETPEQAPATSPKLSALLRYAAG